MKVVYTDEALGDVEAIAEWLVAHYPTVAPAVEKRIRSVVAHLARFPQSARRSAGRTGVRAAPLGRYPYVIFYRVNGDVIEILYVHHAARQRRDDDGSQQA
ncbi:MAG: Plasmid stabilization system [Tardiphaga sp.]|nr:Plasmid stabilization system [Tardiphaga sp.]